MYEKRLCGVVIPTITPMNEDGSIDDASLANFTRYLLGAGVNALSQRDKWREPAPDKGGKGPCGRGYGERERSPPSVVYPVW